MLKKLRVIYLGNKKTNLIKERYPWQSLVFPGSNGLKKTMIEATEFPDAAVNTSKKKIAQVWVV